MERSSTAGSVNFQGKRHIKLKIHRSKLSPGRGNMMMMFLHSGLWSRWICLKKQKQNKYTKPGKTHGRRNESDRNQNIIVFVRGLRKQEHSKWPAKSHLVQGLSSGALGTITKEIKHRLAVRELDDTGSKY